MCTARRMPRRFVFSPSSLCLLRADSLLLSSQVRSYIFDQLSRKMHKGISGHIYRQSHDEYV